MIAGLAVSLLAHAGAMWMVGRVQAASARSEPHELAPIPPDLAPPEEDPPLRLGMDIPQNASIAWLGVLENPVEADAPESEVDQAALTPVVGAQPAAPAEPMPQIETETPPQTEPPIEQPPPDPAEPAPSEPRPTEPLVETPATEPAVEPATQAPPGPPLEARPRPFPSETEPGDGDLPAQNEPSEPASPAESSSEPAPAPQPAEPQIMGPPEPPPQPAPEPAPAPTVPTPAQRPSDAGAPGVEDQRAADAAKRRTARDLRTDLLGQPLQASGDLNFKTVRPTWSLQVRNAYNPRRNPVVEIHFGPDGRVALAEFVPQPDGTRGSGYEEVDQPLLNAIYRWTATGKAIDALDPEDENARVSVVIRFLITSPPRGD
tara:strand:+ start:2252 stop:3376 length:1125 start_codon:yes stop_codon:yes gene_type:complete